MAEQGEQGSKVALPVQGHLEEQEGVLPEIDVHGVDGRWIVQEVFQGVAAGAGNHHHRAVRPQPQEFPVDAGILPAGVVNQAAAMDEAEKLLMQSVHHCSFPHPL